MMKTGTRSIQVIDMVLFMYGPTNEKEKKEWLLCFLASWTKEKNPHIWVCTFSDVYFLLWIDVSTV
jgi:hypothetical protein